MSRSRSIIARSCQREMYGPGAADADLLRISLYAYVSDLLLGEAVPDSGVVVSEAQELETVGVIVLVKTVSYTEHIVYICGRTNSRFRSHSRTSRANAADTCIWLIISS